jgi:CheY-like chemotaxis protein
VKPKRRILLIDSDNDFLVAHRQALEAHGYEVLTAPTGSQGLDTVRAEMPDLVALDVMLEEHDTGFRVAADIKNDPLFRRIPVLLVSSVALTTGYRFSSEDDGYWMKADGYIEKPVEPEVLVRKIDELLDHVEV